MAKNYLKRYVWLIDLISRHEYIKYEDISRAWAFSRLNSGPSASMQQSELPQRTFFNHIDAIYDTFGIEIKCNRDKGYYIANSEDLEGDGLRRWLLDCLSMNNLLNESRDMQDSILFEKIPSGQKWLTTIVGAMRDRKAIMITYQSFSKDNPSSFAAYPYCLKLFKQRWYMLAASEGTDDLRVYSLDERMLDVEMTEEDYEIPDDFHAEEYFSEYFGVIIGSDWEPEDIKIKVVNDQVKYFETLPLHHSQEKITEESNGQYTVYRFHLAPTHDFKKEILSWGPAVEVLAPEDFRQEIKESISGMMQYYGL